MKNSIKVLGAAAAVTITAIASAQAQNGPLFTMDELGKMTINGNPAPPGFLSVEPFSGMVGLTYQLPFPGIPGDVIAFEGGPQPAPMSDLFRFDGHGHMFFFSELEPTDVPPFDPADVPQFPPPVAGLPTVFVSEVGPEGNNSVFYVPGAGPGGDPSNPSYQFISDIPEPGMAGLFLLGAGLFATLNRTRRAHA